MGDCSLIRMPLAFRSLLVRTPENQLNRRRDGNRSAATETYERKSRHLRPTDWLMAVLVVMYAGDAAINHERLDPWLRLHDIQGVVPKTLILVAPIVVGGVIYWIMRWRRPRLDGKPDPR